MTADSTGRLDNIQTLRAVAALLVAYAHCHEFQRGWGGFGSSIQAQHLGVTLFFVISGIVMIITTAARRRDCGSFLAERVARIVPLYWLVTLIVFAIALVQPALLGGTRANLVELAKSLAFIPFLKASGAVRPVVFVGWTLNYEMFFYTLFALGLLLPGRLTGALTTMLVLAILVLVGCWVPQQAVILDFFTRPILLDFVCGIALGMLWLSPRKYAPPVPVAGTLLLVGLSLALLAPLGAMGEAVYTLAATLIATAALSFERMGVPLGGVWLRRLSDASYAIYLSHFFITIAVDNLLREESLPGPATAAILVATLAGCALLGLVIHRWIEVPLTRAARQLLLPQAPTPLPRKFVA